MSESAVAVAALTRTTNLVRPALEGAVGRLEPELAQPALHHLAGGGKGVRGALALISAAGCGADERIALPGAVAVELIHNYSLIHDDIIDHDQERRHRPTVWSAFGVGRAIVVGDALANLAVEVLLEEEGAPRVRATALLAEATSLMIAGQAQDMAFEQREEVSVEETLRMEEGKTGALLSCAAGIGAVLAGADEAWVKSLCWFGQRLGLAFQAVDDVLGIWGEPVKTGKPVGSDLLTHKKSLPVVIARARGGAELDALLSSELQAHELERAARLMEATGARDEVMALADGALQEALESLDSIALVGSAREELVSIAHFVTERDR